MSEFILQTVNLTKKYKGVPVLNNVNIHVPRGSIYGLIGANGAGKSTLLRIFTGSVLPTQGYIAINDKTEYTDIEKERKKIGSIIESPTLYTYMSARDNMIARCKLLGIDNCRERSEEVLASVGLEGVGKKKVKNFSLGMKQRLALALSLLENPEILILDEPTNGLDPMGIAQLRNLLKKMNDEGVTILISSHILAELSKLATHYGILNGGNLIKEVVGTDVEGSERNLIEITFNDLLMLSQSISLLKPLFAADGLALKDNNVIQLRLSQTQTKDEIVDLLTNNGISYVSVAFAKGNIEEYLIKVINGGGGENA